MDVILIVTEGVVIVILYLLMTSHLERPNCIPLSSDKIWQAPVAVNKSIVTKGKPGPVLTELTYNELTRSGSPVLPVSVAGL